MHILGRNADKERLHGLMLTSPMKVDRCSLTAFSAWEQLRGGRS